MNSSTQKRNKLLATLTVLLCITIPHQVNAENIGTQLDNMFGTMSNTTSAGDYQSVTRDGYTGGGFVLRNQLRTLSPVNIQLPSASGGCGGIDLFGGSFSFINAEQFVQMLRNIAANAAGLAFQLALNAMDAVLDNAISKMQAIIQQMNDLTMNSCQLAKGLLVDTASAFGESAKASVSSQLSTDGIVDQFKSYWGNLGGGTAPEVKQQESGERTACNDYGNIMWCLLQNGTFSDQFTGIQQEQKELVMSMTGTIILSDQQGTADDGSVKKAVIDMPPLDVGDIIETLINGNTALKIYSCDGQTESCTNPSIKSLTIDGLSANVTKFFIDDGYLANANAGTNVADSVLQQANYYNVAGASSKATQMARRDLDSSYSYVRNISPVLAYTAAYRYLSDLLTAAATGARFMESNDKSASPYYQKVMEKIKDARANLYRSYMVAVGRYGSEAKIQESFLDYMKSMPAPQFEHDRSPDGSL